ncbi:MAG: tetratricopeptide repeat protein [Polyangiaceae bacterium]|nr:tetratricopeptide repeat protein [Polyangiaceae bacterium]
MRLLRSAALRIALAVAPVAVGCHAGPPPGGALEYSENARRAYDEALDAYFDRDWETAITLFQEVKRKYGYSRWARLADLRIADAEFRQQKYPEAISAYKAFVADYPNDAEVPYAKYRVAKALFLESEPTLLLPPLEERDLGTVQDAYASLRAFLEGFPGYEHERELVYMLEVVTGVLARHELYVARFYRDRGQFPAALRRIEYCLQEFPGSGLDAEALVLLGETHLMMKQPRRARRAFDRVLREHPESAFVLPARRYLARMGAPPAGG